MHPSDTSIRSAFFLNHPYLQKIANFKEMKGFRLLLVTFACGVASSMLALFLSPILGFREGGGGPGAIVYFLIGVLTAGFIAGSLLGLFMFRKTK